MNDANSPGPDAAVSLREITEKTLFPIIKLSDTLSDAQKHMVAPNAVSIAQAHFSKYAWFRAIYADETPVGFLMMYIGPEEDEMSAEEASADAQPAAGVPEEPPTVYFLWRLMVGGPHQGKGYGRAALELVIADLTQKGVTEFLVSCGEGEGSPEGFYRRLGFERNGRKYGDEVGLTLKL
jgi:diamine N-acetyltransferase